MLDEVRVWDSALSQSAIQANINLQIANSSGLVARWALDGTTGTTSVADSVQPEANGTVTGAGWAWGPGAPYDIIVIPDNVPDAPTSVAPAADAIDVETPPLLEVGVSDTDGGQLTTTFYGREVGAPAPEEFTIVVIPDTQHYVDVDEARAAYYTEQTQWIAGQGALPPHDLNIAFVSHLGDITEHFDTAEIEWQHADAAMDILDNAGVPNAVSPGNHDLSTATTPTSNFFDQYFPPSRYDLPANPWYAGWLGQEAGQIDRLNKDNYELFTAGGIDLLDHPSRSRRARLRARLG